MSWGVVRTGRVEAVLISALGEADSTQVSQIQATAGYGIHGDQHAGATRLSDVREDVLVGLGAVVAAPIVNVRQFSALSVEEMKEIAAAMGLAQYARLVWGLPPGVCSENLIISGISDFTALPPGTLLSFAGPKQRRVNSRAVLGIWAENHPCGHPHKNIMRWARNGQSHGLPQGWEPDKAFGSAAQHRRGVVGFVYNSGKISAGDEVSVWQEVDREKPKE